MEAIASFAFSWKFYWRVCSLSPNSGFNKGPISINFEKAKMFFFLLQERAKVLRILYTSCISFAHAFSVILITVF